MYGCTSAYPAYIIVLSGAYPFICELCSNTFADMLLEAYQMHVLKSVYVSVMCVTHTYTAIRPGGGLEFHTAGWVNFICI